jgi:hypothetical protein
MTGFLTPSTYLKLEYKQQKERFESQPAIVQRFLESHPGKIANGLISRVNEVRFSLPDRVLVHANLSGQLATIAIPEAQREQEVGGFWTSLSRQEVRRAIQRRLQELDQSPDQSIATRARLLRFIAATHLVFNSLPSGRAVTYRPDGDETIPSIPIGDNTPESAITRASDAITEQDQVEPGRGELQSTFVPAARSIINPSGWPLMKKANCWSISNRKPRRTSRPCRDMHRFCTAPVPWHLTRWPVRNTSVKGMAFWDSSIKVRGIEARRTDTAQFIAETEMAIMEILAKAEDADDLKDVYPKALVYAKDAMKALRTGRVPMEKLLLQKLNLELGEYSSPSPAAQAVWQLEKAGKIVHPGQKACFLFTLSKPGMHAWYVLEQPDLKI